MDKLIELLKKALAEKDAKTAGRVAEVLRIRYGYTYTQVMFFFQKHTDARLSDGDFEQLMLEVDSPEEE